MNPTIRPDAAVCTALSAALWIVLALPPIRAALEGMMILHMAAQLPLLALVGILFAQALRPIEPAWVACADRLGLCGIAVALFGAAYWMVPRSLDSALAEPTIEAAKFISLPLALGLPLGLSWRRMPSLGKAFLIANFISMVGTVGALYLAAPTRLCLFYVIDQQKLAGFVLLVIAGALLLLFLACALLGLGPARSERRLDLEAVGTQSGRCQRSS